MRYRLFSSDIKEISIDLGLDRQKQVWIFEVNDMLPSIHT
ncbi:YheC/YheD family protein [Desmospora profundinema]